MMEGGQSDIGDVRIEDGPLEDALEAYYRSHPAAQDYGRQARAAKKTIIELMEANHQEAINADDDGVHTGYVVCGRYRFRASKSTNEKKPVKFTPGESSSWDDFEIEVVGGLL